MKVTRRSLGLEHCLLFLEVLDQPSGGVSGLLISCNENRQCLDLLKFRNCFLVAAQQNEEIAKFEMVPDHIGGQSDRPP